VFRSLSQNLRVNIYRLIKIYPIIFVVVKPDLKIKRMGLFENKEYRKIFGPMREEVTRGRRKLRI